MEKTSTVQESYVHPDPMKFTGHERDYNGLYWIQTQDYLDYMHARYYQARMGRFLSVDPSMDLQANPPNPQRWNRYSYVSNNPINKIDPDGRDEYAMDQRLSGIEDDWHGRDKYQAAFLAGSAAAVGVGVAAPGLLAAGAPRIASAILSNPQWIGAASSVLAGFAGQPTVARSISILRPGGRFIGSEGRSKAIRHMSGTAADAMKLFKQLASGGKIEAVGKNHFKVAVDGGHVLIRTVSKEKGVKAVVEVAIDGIGTREVKFK